MKITKKRHLEMAIENIPRFQSHNIDLEQYSTPSIIAADLLWNASSLGDINDKNILDLGCGTGIFAISSILINAEYAMGIDIDSNAINIAKRTAEKMNISNVDFINKNIYEIVEDNNFNNISNNSSTYIHNNIHNNVYKNMDDNVVNDVSKDISESINTDDFNIFSVDFDTVITNPPFGSQSRSKKGADRIFMKSSFKLASVVYSFHMAETTDFVMNFYEKLGGEITHSFRYKFPLPNTYEFHTQDTKYIDVIVLRTIKSH